MQETLKSDARNTFCVINCMNNNACTLVKSLLTYMYTYPYLLQPMNLILDIHYSNKIINDL